MNYRDIIEMIIGIIAVMFAISMLGFLFQQIYLISKGMTTNECLRKKYNNTLFDEGCCRNWNRTCLFSEDKDEQDYKEVYNKVNDELNSQQHL